MPPLHRRHQPSQRETAPDQDRPPAAAAAAAAVAMVAAPAAPVRAAAATPAAAAAVQQLRRQALVFSASLPPALRFKEAGASGRHCGFGLACQGAWMGAVEWAVWALESALRHSAGQAQHPTGQLALQQPLSSSSKQTKRACSFGRLAAACGRHCLGLRPAALPLICPGLGSSCCCRDPAAACQ